jgi:hypothetical protein
LRGEIVLLHDETGPDEVHQRALADEAAGPLRQCQQHVERARTDGDRLAVDEQTTLDRLQLEAAEAKRFRGA